MPPTAKALFSAPLTRFWFACAMPPVLLLLAAVFGGWFSLAAFLWITGVAFVLDEAGLVPVGAMGGAEDRRLTLWLPVALALTHFAMIPLALWSLTAPGHGLAGWCLTFLSFGLWFGQVSNANAHELIHRGEEIVADGDHRWAVWDFTNDRPVARTLTTAATGGCSGWACGSMSRCFLATTPRPTARCITASSRPRTTPALHAGAKAFTPSPRAPGPAPSAPVTRWKPS